MTAKNRRQVLAAGIRATAIFGMTQPMAQQPWLAEGSVDVRDFFRSEAPTHDEAFRAALAGSATVLVPYGNYFFNAPIQLRSGNQLVGIGRPVLNKEGPSYAPLLLAERATGVKLSGLRLVGSDRLERRVSVQNGERNFALPFNLGDPPALAVEVQAGGTRQPLQPGTDFKITNDVIHIALHIDMAKMESLLFWREQAQSPLVHFWETSNSSMTNLACENGALWVGGSADRAQRVIIESCSIANGQIRVYGVHNEVTPLRTGMRRAEPNGPRDVRIEHNKLVGRIVLSKAKHYLRFGERAAGIEVQGSASNVRILENHISGQAGDGIWLPSSSDTLVEGNQIHANGLSGIGLETGTVLPSVRFILRGNTVTNNWFDGCDLNFSTGPEDSEAVIEDNVFSGNGFDMRPLSGGCGIYVNKVRNARITHNLCENNNIAGILCEHSSAIRIDSNHCSGNGRSRTVTFAVGAGIAINNSNNISLQNNIIAGCDDSLKCVAIAFKSVIDRAGAAVSENLSPNSNAAQIGIWNGQGYAPAP